MSSIVGELNLPDSSSIFMVKFLIEKQDNLKTSYLIPKHGEKVKSGRKKYMN